MELTENQKKMLEIITAYQKKHGFPPTVKELADQAGLSVSTTHGYLTRLERAGAIRRLPGSPRAIEILCKKEGEQN
jgi:repressor LexA